MILLYFSAIHGLDLDLSSAHRNLRSDNQRIFDLMDQCVRRDSKRWKISNIFPEQITRGNLCIGRCSFALLAVPVVSIGQRTIVCWFVVTLSSSHLRLTCAVLQVGLRFSHVLSRSLSLSLEIFPRPVFFISLHDFHLLNVCKREKKTVCVCVFVCCRLFAQLRLLARSLVLRRDAFIFVLSLKNEWVWQWRRHERRRLRE